MAYLIDSDVMVDFTRGSGPAADYLDSLRGNCVISAVTALELIAGARNQREVSDLDIRADPTGRVHNAACIPSDEETFETGWPSNA